MLRRTFIGGVLAAVGCLVSKVSASAGPSTVTEPEQVEGDQTRCSLGDDCDCSVFIDDGSYFVGGEGKRVYYNCVSQSFYQIDE